jgi:hypothetical protein
MYGGGFATVPAYLRDMFGFGHRLHLQPLCKIGARAVSYASRRGGRRSRSGTGIWESIMESTRRPSGVGNGIKLVLVWGFVGIPLGWGIVRTLVNAIKAFQ